MIDQSVLNKFWYVVSWLSLYYCDKDHEQKPGQDLKAGNQGYYYYITLAFL